MRYRFIGPHENRRGRRLAYAGKVKLDAPEGFIHLGEFAPDVENGGVVLIVDRTKAKPRRTLLFRAGTTLVAARVLEYYQACFHIEFLFRDAKPFPVSSTARPAKRRWISISTPPSARSTSPKPTPPSFPWLPIK